MENELSVLLVTAASQPGRLALIPISQLEKSIKSALLEPPVRIHFLVLSLDTEVSIYFPLFNLGLLVSFIHYIMVITGFAF